MKMGMLLFQFLKKTETLSIQIYGYQDQIINLVEKDKFIIYMDGEEEALEEVILSVARSKTSKKTNSRKSKCYLFRGNFFK